MSPVPPSTATRGWQWLVLGSILVVALALRVSYATEDLHANRLAFVDEIYNVGNVRSILKTGSLEPVTEFYGSLSYLPPAGLIAAIDALSATRSAFAATPSEVPTVRWSDSRGEFVYERQRLRDLSPWAYLVGRLFSCLYGVLAIWVLWDIGRRVFSPAISLVAASLLAALPVHIHMSGIFKPDALVVLALLLALRTALTVRKEPTLRIYLWAAAWVGIAMSAKPNAAVAAAPLIVASLSLARREPRVRWRLLVAGAVAVAILLMTNPWLGAVEHALEANRAVYGNVHPSMKARGESSALVGLWNAPWMQLDQRYFGVVVGLIGLTGLVSWTGGLLSRRVRGSRAEQLALLMSLPVAYWLSIAVFLRADASIEGTPIWAIYLPMTPVICLAAAWLLARVVDRAASRGTRGVLAALVATLVAWSLMRGPLELHRRNTSVTAFALAEWKIQNRFAHPDRRLVCTELASELEIGKRGEVPSYFRVPSLRQLDPMTLEACDVELHRAGLPARLPVRSWIARRAEQHGASSVEFLYPRLFRLRGPGVAVVWHPRDPPTKVPVEWEMDESATGISGSMAVPTGDIASFALWLRPPDPDPDSVELRVDNQRIVLFPSRGSQSNRLSSGRFTVQGEGRFEIVLSRRLEETEIVLRAFLWARPAPFTGTGDGAP
jgi:hypothetical protein